MPKKIPKKSKDPLFGDVPKFGRDWTAGEDIEVEFKCVVYEVLFTEGYHGELEAQLVDKSTGEVRILKQLGEYRL